MITKIDAGLAVDDVVAKLRAENVRLLAENVTLAHDCYRFKSRIQAMQIANETLLHPELIPPPPDPPDPWEKSRA